MEDNELIKTFVGSTSFYLSSNQWMFIESVSDLVPSIQMNTFLLFACIKIVGIVLENTQFVCGCLTPEKGPVVVVPHWSLCCVVFQGCITALLDLISLEKKKKKRTLSLFPPLSEKCTSWLYEYWWLLPVPCHLGCCQENPEKGEENLQSLKIASLRKNTWKTGFAFLFIVLWNEWST